MTYQEAIEEAKEIAKRTGYCCSVCQYKKHWWSRRRYSCGWPGTYNLQRAIYVKLLTITPSGTIAQ